MGAYIVCERSLRRDPWCLLADSAGRKATCPLTACKLGEAPKELDQQFPLNDPAPCITWIEVDRDGETWRRATREERSAPCRRREGTERERWLWGSSASPVSSVFPPFASLPSLSSPHLTSPTGNSPMNCAGERKSPSRSRTNDWDREVQSPSGRPGSNLFQKLLTRGVETGLGPHIIIFLEVFFDK